MDDAAALAALGALAQNTRLDAYRLLIRHEPDGLSVGQLALALRVPHNTMSVHLAKLARAGLIRAERRSRVVNYRADLAHLKALNWFLIKDCCDGDPSACAPLLAGQGSAPEAGRPERPSRLRGAVAPASTNPRATA